MSEPFKMKGSPMQRNFGIGASPEKKVPPLKVIRYQQREIVESKQKKKEEEEE